jgi:hypothetical protein
MKTVIPVAKDISEIFHLVPERDPYQTPDVFQAVG